MFNIAASTYTPDFGRTISDGMARGQQYKANKMKQDSYLYEFGKQKKVDKAKEALYTAEEGSPEQRQAQGMLMAHAPEYLADMAEQQRKSAEEARKVEKHSRDGKQADADLSKAARDSMKDIAPIMQHHATQIKGLSGDQRIGYIQQNMESVIAQMPEAVRGPFQQGIQQTLADGQVTDEELDGILQAFPVEAEDPVNYQFKENDKREIIALNPQDPSAAPIHTGQYGKDNKGGMLLRMDENGNPVFASGAGGIAAAGAIQGTNSTKSKLQDSLTTQSTTMATLDALHTMYDPEFMTYKSDATAFASKVKEKFGGDLDAAEKDHLTRKTKFTTQLNRMFNAYRKEITGAAAAVKEMKDLKNSLINEDMSATEYEAAYQSLRDEVSRTMRIKNKLLREGYSGKDLGEQIDNAFLTGGDDDPEEQLAYLMENGLSEKEAVARMESEGYQ